MPNIKKGNQHTNVSCGRYSKKNKLDIVMRAILAVMDQEIETEYISVHETLGENFWWLLRDKQLLERLDGICIGGRCDSHHGNRMFKGLMVGSPNAMQEFLMEQVEPRCVIFCYSACNRFKND